MQAFEEGQVRIDRRLAQPIAAVGPAAVVQDVRQMTVEREDELHPRWFPPSSGRSVVPGERPPNGRNVVLGDVLAHHAVGRELLEPDAQRVLHLFYPTEGDATLVLRVV